MKRQNKTCYHCKLYQNKTTYMNKRRAVDMKQIIWKCPVCNYFTLIMDFRTIIKYDRNNNPLPPQNIIVSVFMGVMKFSNPQISKVWISKSRSNQ